MAERWLPALRPWCLHLAGCATLTAERDPRDESGASWLLSVALDTDSADGLLTSREALGLLAIVARVDLHGWQLLLADFCGCARASDAVSEVRVMPRVLFESPPPSPPVDPAFSFDAVALRRLLLPAAPPSAECRAAARHLLRLMTPAMREAFRQSSAFRTRATLAFVPPDRLRGGPRRYFESIRSTVQALAAYQAQCATANRADEGVNMEDQLLLDPLALELDRCELDLARVKPRDIVGSSDVLADLVALGVQPFPELDLSPQSALSTLPLTRAGAIFVGLTNAEAATAAVHQRPARVFSEKTSALVVSSKSVEPAEPSRSHRRRLQALFSALAVSQDLKTLRVSNVLVNDNASARRHKWRWLTYALLSHDAHASVESLTLEDSNFGASDMRAIVSVLACKYPAHTLYDRASLLDFFTPDPTATNARTAPASSTTGSFSSFSSFASSSPAVAYAPMFAKDSLASQFFQRPREPGAELLLDNDDDPLAVDEDLGCVHLDAGDVVYVNPFDVTEEMPETLKLSMSAAFPIIRNDTRCPWIDIVVPGYGYCAVPRALVKRIVTRADTGDTTPRKSSLETGYHGAIKSLTLRFTTLEQVDDLLLPLFRYLGPQLEAVDLSHLVALAPEDLCRIISLCPRLTGMDFNVSEPHGGLLALAQAYDDGRCRVEELCLVECQTYQHVAPFVKRLGDPSSAIAKALRRLTFDSVHEDEVLPEEALNAVAAMLQTNNTLEYVELDVFPEVARSTWLQLIATDGKVLPVVKTPLPLEARVAFLSVVQSGSSSSSSLPPATSQTRLESGNDASGDSRRNLGDLRSLDRDVVRLIFLFAAEPKTRTVCLQVFELEAEDEFEDVEDFEDFGDDEEGEGEGDGEDGDNEESEDDDDDDSGFEDVSDEEN